MPSIAKRATILILCRIMNYGIMLLSRSCSCGSSICIRTGSTGNSSSIATLIAGLIDFSISTNLIYFIPKYPDRERQSVTHTTLLILITSAVGFDRRVSPAKASSWPRRITISSLPLVAVLSSSLNFEFFESYWLGKKRTDYRPLLFVRGESSFGRRRFSSPPTSAATS